MTPQCNLGTLQTLNFGQNFRQSCISYKICTIILQVCYNAEHFLQDSDNILAKFATLCRKFSQIMRWVIFRWVRVSVR